MAHDHQNAESPSCLGAAGRASRQVPRPTRLAVHALVTAGCSRSAHGTRGQQPRLHGRSTGNDDEHLWRPSTIPLISYFDALWAGLNAHVLKPLLRHCLDDVAKRTDRICDRHQIFAIDLVLVEYLAST